jgi:hypothetical protein
MKLRHPDHPRVVIARGAFADIYEPAWNRALKEIGASSELFDAHALTLPGLPGRVERRILWGPGVVRIRRALIARVEETRPDITLLYQGHYYDGETVAALSRLSFVVGYHNDDPFGTRGNMLRYRHLLPALPQYQGFHVFRRINLAEAISAGARRVGLLRSYYLPWVHYPQSLDVQQSREFGCDLVFAGHAEQDIRIGCISDAVRAGIAVKLFGEDRFWKRALDADVYDRLGPTSKVLGERYRLALCGAKIAACFFSKWNRDQYTQRVFEIPACGIFMLSERTDEMLELFNEGQEAAYFSSKEEFVDKTRYYLAHDSERQRIAANGADRVRADKHDIHSRMRQWLADVTTWMREA